MDRNDTRLVMIDYLWDEAKRELKLIQEYKDCKGTGWWPRPTPSATKVKDNLKMMRRITIEMESNLLPAYCCYGN